MRWKYALLALLAIIMMMCWSGCQAIIFTVRYPGLVVDAKKRLETISQLLPTAPGSVLVRRVDDTGGGQMLECEARVVAELYGTDELSFAEVLDFYTASLQAMGWRPRLATDRARTFTKDDEFNLEVSDNYNVSMVGLDAIQEGQSRFKTIFLLELNTPILIPPPSECRQG